MTSRIVGLLLCVAALFACGAGNVAKGRGVFKASEGGVSYWTDPYTNWLQACWRFETTNTTATLDTSGNGRHATNTPNVATGPTWSTNESGHCYDFDGSDDEFVADRHFWGGWTSATICCWIKLDAQTDWAIFAGSAEDTGKANFQIGQWDDAGEFAGIFRDQDGNYSYSITPALFTNSVWSFLCAQWMMAGGTNFVWHNQTLVASNQFVDADNTLSSGADDFRIGRDARSAGRYCNGKIDNIRVYNMWLPMAAVTNLFWRTHPDADQETPP